MNADRHCTECGTRLTDISPEALCLKCLLEVGAKGGLDETQIGDRTAGAAELEASLSSGQPFVRPLLELTLGRFGEYELLEEIARGGMGIVYRARQVSLDRIVALKVLLAGPLARKDFVQRFRTEAAAAASLQHPNIVAIHEVGFAGGQHFFAMDYVEGLTLGQLAAKGPLPARHAATYLKTIAEAIHFAHERNVLHRDLKPSNVLIDSATDQPRLTDFGLAKRLDAETDLTLSGQVLGSPNYMSPEQAVAKRGTVGKHSDIYSLGAIFYHLLTGRAPFQGETLTDVLHQVVNDDPLAPHLLLARVPHDLETICLKCLEKEPSRRYHTARELADELGRFLRDEPILARPVSHLENVWRWGRRNPALASLGASLALVFTLGFTGTLWQWRQAVKNAKAEAKQHQLAMDNWRRAEDNRERADQSLYDADLKVAQVAWDEGDLGRSLGLLEDHRPRGAETDRRGFEWFYFRNLCGGDQRMTLRGHNQTVNCIAFSPDGKLLATGSVEDPVQIWDSATGKVVKTLPEQHVLSLEFSPDGQMLGVGGQDQGIVWNLGTERAVFKREAAAGQFRIAFSPTGALLAISKGADQLGNDGGSAELIDYRTGESKHIFPESGGHIAFSTRGDLLATGTWNKCVIIWDLASGKMVRSLETGGVIAMALSPDGQSLATSNWGAKVELWDVTTGRRIGSFSQNDHRVWSLAFSPEGTLLATGGADQMVSLWDVRIRQQIEQLRGHGSEVMSVAFSPDGQTLASGSKDKTAMLWGLHPNRVVTTVSNVTSRPIFSANGQVFAAGIGQNKVAAWNTATLRKTAVFAGACEPVAFSSDGRTLLTRGTNYFLRTFDVATQARGETIRGPALETGCSAGLSPNGKMLVSCLGDGTLTFFDARTGDVMATNALLYGSQLTFFPNGKLLATGVTSDLVTKRFGTVIWDLVTQKAVTVLAGHSDWVLSTAFSPDSKILVTCGADDSIKFWETTTWKEIPPSIGHKEYVTCLAFSPNRRTLATSSADGTVKLWNAASHRELASLKLLAGLNLTFSPDGNLLAAWDWDGAIRLRRAPILPDKERSQPPDS